MIQENELRHNNYYIINGNIEQYNILSYGQWNLSCYNPIPLTPEILEKCGFINDGFYNSAERWVLLGMLLFRGNGYFILCHYPMSEIKHLHQLQNLYFALTGEELTLKTKNYELN